MARKHQLRVQRAGTVINLASKDQEGRQGSAMTAVAKRLSKEFGIVLTHQREWKLADVVAVYEGSSQTSSSTITLIAQRCVRMVVSSLSVT